ncbi:FRG domain-containing protein [Paenibacillus fonticola]|uniref:FRG domain-containing protein n=1 Tax=Paenibacillus fonticola TaxID=379896 RepID=UPI000360E3EA|nr:FRG domain-containing protein [Paenibacillus fonticola]
MANGVENQIITEPETEECIELPEELQAPEHDGKIRKLSEYMSFVEKLPATFSLSRGQTGDFPLLPSALRKDNKGNRKYAPLSITHFLKQFKINSHYYMDSPWDIQNDYEWMIHAQHFGIPTRLLDFTQSHIIALMFAVETAFTETTDDDTEPRDAVVWFLDPKKLNPLHSHRTDLIVLSERDIRLDELSGPVIVQGRKLNSRINAQNGVFLYFQDTAVPLEEQVNSEDILRKVIISGKHKKDILASLYAMGIGFTQIYPELSSIAKDILMIDSISQYNKYRQEGGGE